MVHRSIGTAAVAKADPAAQIAYAITAALGDATERLVAKSLLLVEHDEGTQTRYRMLRLRGLRQ